MNRLSRPLQFGHCQTPSMARFPTRRHRVNRGFALLSMTAFLVAGGVLAYALNMRAPRPQITGHARIIDGDSLMVAGTEVRLWGIDAPELFQRCMRDGREVQCGREAARALIAMVAGQQVTCNRRDMDRFGQPSRPAASRPSTLLRPWSAPAMPSRSAAIMPRRRRPAPGAAACGLESSCARASGVIAGARSRARDGGN